MLPLVLSPIGNPWFQGGIDRAHHLHHRLDTQTAHHFIPAKFLIAPLPINQALQRLGLIGVGHFVPLTPAALLLLAKMIQIGLAGPAANKVGSHQCIKIIRFIIVKQRIGQSQHIQRWLGAVEIPAGIGYDFKR